jgi:hypothetical protein
MTLRRFMRVTIPLDAKGRPALFDKQADDGDDYLAIDKFFRQYLAGADWRYTMTEWLGPATELAQR